MNKRVVIIGILTLVFLTACSIVSPYLDVIQDKINSDGGVNGANSTKYTISYDANGATGGSIPGPQAKVENLDLILASNSGNLVRAGYTFAGWNTTADGSGNSYDEGPPILLILHYCYLLNG